MQLLFNFLLLCRIYVIVTASNLKKLKRIMLMPYSLGLQPVDFYWST